MKPLSLARPLAIIVIGLPGSGKSFFARQFADMFRAPLVSYDYVRHGLFPNSEFSPEEDSYVNLIASNLLGELLKTQKTVVIDGGTWDRTTRPLLEKELRSAGYGLMSIWVQTDVTTCRSRSTKRNQQRDGDRLNASMSPDSFERVAKQFIPPSNKEDHVVISGKHTFSSQARVVLKKLVSPRDGDGLTPEKPRVKQQAKGKLNDIHTLERRVSG